MPDAKRFMRPTTVPALLKGIRLFVPLLALLGEGLVPALGVLLIQEAGAWIARRLRGEALYLAAFGLRAVLAFVLFAILARARGQGTFLQDDYVFDLAAWWLVRIGSGEALSLFPGHTYFLDNVYAYFLAGVYALFGHTASVPRAANAAFAGLVAVLLMDIGRRLYGPRVGQLIGIAAVVLPTLVVWSLTTLKETLVLLGITAALWSLLLLYRSTIPSSRAANVALIALVAGALVGDLRPGALFVLLLVALFLGLSRERPGWRPGYRALLGGGLLVAGALGLAALRTEASAQAVGREIESFFFALLAPAPWQVRGWGDLAASLEMLLWYALLAGAAYVLAARPRASVEMVALAIYGLATWIGLAQTEGNLGNLLRHRTMLTPPLLVLGIAGLHAVLQRLRLGRRAKGTSPPGGELAQRSA